MLTHEHKDLVQNVCTAKYSIVVTAPANSTSICTACYDTISIKETKNATDPLQYKMHLFTANCRRIGEIDNERE